MKQTALHHHHQRSGATWTSRHGWEIPAAFGDREGEAARARTGVGIADVSYLQKFECPQMNPGAWKLTSKKYFLIGEPPIETPAGALDITSVFAAFLLAGPQSRAVLRKLTSLNVSEASMPSGRCAQASLAHAPATVLRDDLGSLPAYKILVTRDYAESVWESILHAGHEFHMVPLGVEALDRLRS